jgi:hypothetical protein
VSDSEVSRLLTELRSGRASLAAVAARFRELSWPSVRNRDADPDPGTDVPGSYDEVTAAYDRGELSSREYHVLSDAVAAGIDAELRTRAGDRSPDPAG